MDKRTLLAVAICMGILLLWWKIFPPTPPHSQSPPSPPVAAQTQTPGPAGTTAPAPAGAAGTLAAPVAGAAARAPEQRVTLRSPGARFVLSSWGGVLREAYMEEPRFLASAHDP